jgi:hypothetical protein
MKIQVSVGGTNVNIKVNENETFALCGLRRGGVSVDRGKKLQVDQSVLDGNFFDTEAIL